MKCPQCGLELPSEALFCPDCGYQLKQEAASEQTSVNTSPQSAAQAAAEASSRDGSSSHERDKKRSALPLIALVLLLLCAAGVFVYMRRSAAPRTVAITAEIFPDDTLRSYVADELDSDGDGKLSDAEAAGVTKISLDGVINARGFEYFPNLTELTLGGGTLTSALINAPKLESLDISQSAELTELQFEVPVPELKSINADGTALEALDLGQSTKLENVVVPEGTELILPEELADEEQMKQIVHATKRAGTAPAIWIVESVTGTQVQASDSYRLDRDLTNIGTYDQDGRLSSREQLTSTGATYSSASYQYDALGRLISFVGSSESEMPGDVFSENWTASWSSDGRTATWTGGGNSQNMSATMVYDERGLPVSFEGRDMHIGQQLARSTATYAYDEAGRLSGVSCTIAYIPLDAGWSDNYEANISYNEAGLLATITIDVTTPYSSFSYAYTFDEQGRIISREDSIAGNATFTYDDAGALVSAAGDNLTADFTTDEHGNVKTASITRKVSPSSPVTITENYELSWREVEAYEDGSYPYGVVSTLDPLSLSSAELFGLVEAGNATSLLELERLICKSQAIAIAGVQEMPAASEAEQASAEQAPSEPEATSPDAAATEPETALADEGEWYEDEFIRIRKPEYYDREYTGGSPSDAAGYMVHYEQLNSTGSRAFTLFNVVVVDGNLDEPYILAGQTSQGYNVYVDAPSGNYDEIVATLTIK